MVLDKCGLSGYIPQVILCLNFLSVTATRYELEWDKTVFQIAEQLGVELEALTGLLDKFFQKLLITNERIPVELDRAS